MSRVVRDTVDGVVRQGTNRVVRSRRIDQPWNRPRLESFDWPQWSRQWSDALAQDLKVVSGDWSQTVFCAGFLHSGSSAIADCLYGSLDVHPPPRETITFRARQLPALIERSKSLRDFMLESVIGVSANPWERRHAWLKHAVAANLQSQILPKSVRAREADTTYLSAARLAHSFLAPNSNLLVLDNALHREHTSVAGSYAGSKWVLVLRDLPSQYAQLQSPGSSLTVGRFCDFIEASISQCIENLAGMSTYWIKFDNFVLEAEYRNRVLDLLKPGLVAKSSQYFRPTESAKNTRLGQTLPFQERATLEMAERQIYERIDFVCL